MKPLMALALLAAVAAPGVAFANPQLAQAKQCMQCHAVDRDTIGPSFQKVAAVYRGMQHPEASLIAVMREGSAANLGPHWGKARMPDSSERPLIDDAEAQQLARWILSLH